MSQPNSAFSLRPAQLEDVDRIADIEAVSFPCPWSKNLIRQEILARGPTRFIVAESVSGGTVIGYVSYSVAAEEMHIVNLATHPDYRRRGIARALTDACMEAGRSEGAGVVHLEVRESNAAAIELYNQLGFRQVGLRKRYYVKPVEDALLYTLELIAASGSA
ncbi:MAG: ribosomal protein S18-alanine N-acetyltransferase [bacterium]